VPEKLLAAEILEIGIFEPGLAEALVREVVGVFQDLGPGHQPRGQRRPARRIRVNSAKGLLQKRPIDLARKLHHWMLQIDNLLQPRTEQVLLAGLALLPWLHGFPPQIAAGPGNHDLRMGKTGNRICKKTGGKPAKTCKSPGPHTQSSAEKSAC